MATLNTFDAEVGAEQVAAAIERDGYAIVRGLLDPEALARLSGELTPHLEATELGAIPTPSSGTRRSVSARCSHAAR